MRQWYGRKSCAFTSHRATDHGQPGTRRRHSLRGGGSPDLGGGRSIFMQFCDQGGSETARATLKAYIVLVTAFAVRGDRPPPFTNRELPRKDLRVVNARLVGIGRVLLLGLAAWALAADAVAQPGSKADPESAVRLTAAAEQGTFNVGAGKANLARVVDPVVGREILKLDFSLPVGTAVGVWAKNFPSPIGSENIDVAQIGVRADASDLDGFAAVMEIKGSGGSQRIAIPLTPAWSLSEAVIEWQLVGAFREAVVVVSQAGSEPATGTLHLDVRFDRLSPARKLSTHVTARLGGVLIVSLAGALFAALLGRLFGPKRTADARDTAGPVSTPSPFAGLRRDFVIGTGIILIASLAISIYGLSTKGILEVGWSALLAAVAGAVIAEWLKFGLTGKHQDPLQVFQNMAATGLLAASASSLAILQAPAAWSELLMLSGTAAASAVLLYHLINAGMLASAGKHVSASSAVLIAGAPFVVGGLTLLASPQLLRPIGRRSCRCPRFAPGVARVDRPSGSSLLFQCSRNQCTRLRDQRDAASVSAGSSGSACRRDRGYHRSVDCQLWIEPQHCLFTGCASGCCDGARNDTLASRSLGRSVSHYRISARRHLS